MDQTINQAHTGQLQGQSPYIINTGIYYQNDSIGLQVSILYNVFGPRVYLVGTLDYPNIGEMPRHSFDLTLSKTIIKKLVLNLGIQDIFNQPVLLIQDTNRNNKFETNGNDKEIMRYKKGSYFSIGLTLKI